VLRFAAALDPPPAVVLMSARTSCGVAVAAQGGAPVDVVEKPISDVEALRSRLRRALSRRDERMARRSSPAAAGQAGRVLLVEGAGGRRRLMAEFLSRHYEVTTATDGEEALTLLRKGTERFDLVLADRNLPGMSGLRVIEQAQRLLPHCASVLYTAYPSLATVKQAFEAGVETDLASLAEKVDRALRGRGGILLG
jgi:CheY-like chemotaxis protein